MYPWTTLEKKKMEYSCHQKRGKKEEKKRYDDVMLLQVDVYKLWTHHQTRMTTERKKKKYVVHSKKIKILRYIKNQVIS